ncbi:hypothetical protein AW736_17935 [Termitidicoccus mucosus]|uniref:Plasmid stabilization protein n=1 Tax=Termitidicoccus mucosus TaxID=1184151 RepID=A0A178IEU9_9BACT|nr:hypothetical protein AW736_17935 [Opitutaceae bacterium TSB47]
MRFRGYFIGWFVFTTDLKTARKSRLKAAAPVVLYHEQRREGTGARLRGECVGDAAAQPQFCWVWPGGYRRVNLHGFPYCLPYVVWDDVLHVLAVAHASREPEYWVGRPRTG